MVKLADSEVDAISIRSVGDRNGLESPEMLNRRVHKNTSKQIGRVSALNRELRSPSFKDDTSNPPGSLQGILRPSSGNIVEI